MNIVTPIAQKLGCVACFECDVKALRIIGRCVRESDLERLGGNAYSPTERLRRLNDAELREAQVAFLRLPPPKVPFVVYGIVYPWTPTIKELERWYALPSPP